MSDKAWKTLERETGQVVEKKKKEEGEREGRDWVERSSYKRRERDKGVCVCMYHPVLVMAMDTELSMRLACAWLCRDSAPSVGQITTNCDNPYLKRGDFYYH